jgi:hypothetical protein
MPVVNPNVTMGCRKAGAYPAYNTPRITPSASGLGRSTMEKRPPVVVKRERLTHGGV